MLAIFFSSFLKPHQSSIIHLHPRINLTRSFHRSRIINPSRSIRFPTRSSSSTTTTSSSSSSKQPKYGFQDAVSDINLKWTVPIGLVLGVGLWYYLQNELSSRPSHVKIDEPLPPLIVLNRPASDQMIDSATGLPIPAELKPNHLELVEPLRLVGLGVRTVSFLGVKVYVAGFYADPSILRALRVVPGWNDDLTKENFLSAANRSGSLSADSNHQGPAIQGEGLFRNLISAPSNFAIRIAPVRPTDFTHLRDGFCRSLLARIKLASETGTISDSELERASQSVNTFRAFFPTGVSVPKGKEIILVKTANQSLIVEHEGKKLGELNDPVIARELFLAYFADKDPISLPLKESVSEGFSSLYSVKN